MKTERTFTDDLFAAFLTLCSVVLVESALLRLAGSASPVAVGLAAPAFVAAMTFIYRSRRKVMIFAGVAAIILPVLLVLRIADISRDEVVSFSADTVSALFRGAELGTGQTIFAAAVMSLLLSAALFPLLKLRVARYIVAAAVPFLLVYYGIFGISCDFTERFAAAGIMLSVPAELCVSLLYGQNQRKKLIRVLSYLMPLFVIFSLTVAALPSSDKPISWSFVTRFAAGVAETFEALMNDIDILLHPDPPDFSIGMQGYSDSDSVFGDNSDNNGGNRLSISLRRPSRSSIYLTGTVCDVYTGKGWKQSKLKTFSQNDPYLDYCETVLAFERAGYRTSELSEFTERTFISIRYEDIVTKSLFHPLKIIGIYTSANYNASSPTVLLKKRAQKNDSYELLFLEINYHSEQFARLFDEPFSYDDGIRIGFSEQDRNIPAGIEDVLAKRAAYIKEAYCDIPDSVTPRMRSLAAEITQDCKNDYEKLLAIEKYLRGYEYTLTPGDVPKGQDAVDYFLFDSGKGYCTYFASAMVLLARCEGIPARYTQGFAIDRENISISEESHISNEQAHAWAEAYLEGVGWVPFEPTAALGSARDRFADAPKYVLPVIADREFDYPEDDPSSDEERSGDEAKGDGGIPLYIPIIMAALGGILLIVLLYAAIRMRMFVRMYRTGTDTDRFMLCYKMSLHLHGKNKNKLETGETADRFAQRLSLAYPVGEVSFLRITEVFDRIRYGGGEASPDESALAEEYLRAMFAKLREQRGRVAALKAFAGCCLTQQG